MNEFCPKCTAPKLSDSCPKCGLVFKKFDPSVFEEGIPASLMELWQQTEKDWDDKTRHSLFVKQAIDEGHVGYAASCYRRRSDDKISGEQLDHLSLWLEHSMKATATTPTKRSSEGHKGMILVFLLIIAAAMVGLFLLKKHP